MPELSWQAERQVVCWLVLLSIYYLLSLSWVTRDLLGLLVTATENQPCPTLTSPTPLLWVSGSSPQGTGHEEERGVERKTEILGWWCCRSLPTTSPTQIQNPDSSSLPSIGWIHQLGSGIIWGLVGAIWEAPYLWTSAWDKEGLRKWIIEPADSLIP